jgi:hypothetical protein
MTRKDYKKIAELLYLYPQPLQFVHELTNILEEDNPRFDREKFLTACGVK